MVENPMNNAVIVKTQVTLSVDVVKFEVQDVITASSGVETHRQRRAEQPQWRCWER